MTARNAVAASSRLPAFTVSRKFFSSVFKRDLTDLFWVCLRSLLRMRFSADFVFGILNYKIPVIEPVTVTEVAILSMQSCTSRVSRICLPIVEVVLFAFDTLARTENFLKGIFVPQPRRSG